MNRMIEKQTRRYLSSSKNVRREILVREYSENAGQVDGTSESQLQYHLDNLKEYAVRLIAFKYLKSSKDSLSLKALLSSDLFVCVEIATEAVDLLLQRKEVPLVNDEFSETWATFRQFAKKLSDESNSTVSYSWKLDLIYIASAILYDYVSGKESEDILTIIGSTDQNLIGREIPSSLLDAKLPLHERIVALVSTLKLETGTNLHG